MPKTSYGLQDFDLLTLREVAAALRCSKAHVSNVIVGLVTSDPASVESVLAWAARLQDRVDYVIVENATRPQSDFSYWRHSNQSVRFCLSGYSWAGWCSRTAMKAAVHIRLRQIRRHSRHRWQLLPRGRKATMHRNDCDQRGRRASIVTVFASKPSGTWPPTLTHSPTEFKPPLKVLDLALRSRLQRHSRLLNWINWAGGK
jgi:hypothetical protein